MGNLSALPTAGLPDPAVARTRTGSAALASAPARLLWQGMTEDPDDPPRLMAWLHRHMSVAIGIAGLIAWFIMLWLMFGDVL